MGPMRNGQHLGENSPVPRGWCFLVLNAAKKICRFGLLLLLIILILIILLSVHFFVFLNIGERSILPKKNETTRCGTSIANHKTKCFCTFGEHIQEWHQTRQLRLLSFGHCCGSKALSGLQDKMPACTSSLSSFFSCNQK